MQREMTRSAIGRWFGPEQWERYFGAVDERPPLPDGIDDVLQSPCPIWQGRTVAQTHKLFLVPTTVGGAPANLSVLGELIQRPREGHPAKYLYYSSYVRTELGFASAGAPHWCLMTTDVIPGTRSKDYKDQRRAMDELSDRIGIRYQLPTTLQAALCILTHYVETEERIFAKNDAERSWSFTRCQEQISSDKWAVAVGGFEEKGLLLYRSPDFMFDRHFAGTAGVRVLGNGGEASQ